jgi:hypothetical protein
MVCFGWLFLYCKAGIVEVVNIIFKCNYYDTFVENNEKTKIIMASISHFYSFFKMTFKIVYIYLQKW